MGALVLEIQNSYTEQLKIYINCKIFLASVKVLHLLYYIAYTYKLYVSFIITLNVTSFAFV